jgi:outer membrane lipoprotein-sorting protein
MEVRYKLAGVMAVAVITSLAFAAPTGKSASSSGAVDKGEAQSGAAAANDPTGVALLQQMEQQHGSMRSVTGSFSQVRTDPAFGEKIDAKARFALLKPDNFRVEYLPPKESVNLISGRTTYRYVPANKQVERYRSASARDVTYMLLGFGASAQELLKVYTVQPGENGNSIKLLPRNKKESQYKYVVMEIDPARLLPRRFSMEQSDGTKIVVTMDTDGLQVNAPLSGRDFQPNFPPEAKMVDMD